MDDSNGPETVEQAAWVGVGEVARHLGVVKDTVYRWVESRGLPAHRVGRLLRFRLSEVDAWIERHRAGRIAEPRMTYGNAGAVETAAEIRSAIREMVRRIVEQFDPERIVLFGSHARGDAGPDSDVDLLVVTQVDGSKAELEIEIGVALDDIPLPKDIVVATPGEMEKYWDVVGTIIRPALLEGRTLYERTA